jgi:hypothetical protein
MKKNVGSKFETNKKSNQTDDEVDGEVEVEAGGSSVCQP